MKLSSKHQIVIPREAREKLGLRAGDHIHVRVEGDRIVMEKAAADPVSELEGLFEGAYGDDSDRYLREERGSWEE
ncbi:MAG TPA: AbrB/MazE/SpoVT family DNA-binding domain-containing protein [Longimicrobiaceae bacterium]|nr:AbrB/MazE/SpoVT family DNA-binding domain-containing protein [Longimicrobiaceae bacterium]